MFPRFLVLVLVGVAAFSGVVAADGNESGDGGLTVNVGVGEASNETDPDSALRWIDNLTAIESSDYAGGEMRLVLVSTVSQRVTLVDAGGVFGGGEVTRRQVRLQEGRNEVSIPVTEIQNSVVVTIGTRNVLYAEPIRTGSSLISGPWNKSDVQTAALSGLGAGVGVTALIAFRRVRGVSDAPRRIL